MTQSHLKLLYSKIHETSSQPQLLINNKQQNKIYKKPQYNSL